MKDLLEKPPRLTLVTGPVNSSKSWLLQCVIDDLKRESRHQKSYSSTCIVLHTVCQCGHLH